MLIREQVEGSISRTGAIRLNWNLQETKLYSPDGTRHCLPCEMCGIPQWVGLRTVSVVCPDCANSLLPEIEEPSGYEMEVCQ